MGRMSYFGSGSDRRRAAELEAELHRMKERAEKAERRAASMKNRLDALEMADRRRNWAAQELASIMADPAELERFRESAWMDEPAAWNAERGDYDIPPSGWPDRIAADENGIERFVAEKRDLVEVRLLPREAAAEAAPKPRQTFIQAERERAKGGQP